MLIQANLGYAMLHRLELPKGAHDLLSALNELQKPGGEVRISQSELAALVGLSKNAASTALAALVDRGLVLRPERSYRLYYLHPYIAGYADQEQMETAIRETAQRIRAGELPDLRAPRYDVAPPRRQHTQGLRAVSGA